MIDMHKKGRAGPQFAKGNRHAAKLTDEQVRDAVLRRHLGDKCREIAEDLGVTAACIATATRKAGYHS